MLSTNQLSIHFFDYICSVCAAHIHPVRRRYVAHARIIQRGDNRSSAASYARAHTKHTSSFASSHIIASSHARRQIASQHHSADHAAALEASDVYVFFYTITYISCVLNMCLCVCVSVSFKLRARSCGCVGGVVKGSYRF